MTKDDYKLYTGQSAEQYSDEEWTKLVDVASGRLASLLCLEELPSPLPDDLTMLLANFVCAMLHYSGNGQQDIASKSVRNFSISYSTKSAANVFEQLSENYADIIAKYSVCKLSLKVEDSAKELDNDGI